MLLAPYHFESASSLLGLILSLFPLAPFHLLTDKPEPKAFTAGRAPGCNAWRHPAAGQAAGRLLRSDGEEEEEETTTAGGGLHTQIGQT